MPAAKLYLVGRHQELDIRVGRMTEPQPPCITAPQGGDHAPLSTADEHAVYVSLLWNDLPRPEHDGWN